MPTLRLEGETDSFNLDDITETGFGAEALTGVTGLGLPAVSPQWFEGAGDGAVFRGKRFLPREVDVPLFFRARNRVQLQELMSRVSIVLDGEMTLRFVEDDGSDWSLVVHRVGGGQYVYGVDTIGETELRTVVTLRAGDPFWTYNIPKRVVVGTSNPGRGLIKGASFARMKLSGSQASGQILLENPGDVDAVPVWELTGPGTDFTAIGPKGDSFVWNGTLDVGETLTIDAATARVTDGTGANRYAELGPAPRFWKIPPGQSQANVLLSGTSTGSQIVLTFKRRKRLMV